MNTYIATIPVNPENITFQLPYAYKNTHATMKCTVNSDSNNNLTVTFKVETCNMNSTNPIDGRYRRIMRNAIKTIANMASINNPVLEVRDKNNKVHSVSQTPGERDDIIMHKMQNRREYRNMLY